MLSYIHLKQISAQYSNFIKCALSPTQLLNEKKKVKP